jgi:hypothetical protein
MNDKNYICLKLALERLQRIGMSAEDASAACERLGKVMNALPPINGRALMLDHYRSRFGLARLFIPSYWRMLFFYFPKP